MPEYKLPDVGEGLTEAEVVAWRVKVGDVIEVNEIVCDIETAKSIVELPSPYAGEVTALLVPEGETVAVGTPIIRIGADSAVEEVAQQPSRNPDADMDIDLSNPAASGGGEGESLVGRNKADRGPTRRARRAPGAEAANKQAQAAFDPGTSPAPELEELPEVSPPSYSAVEEGAQQPSRDPAPADVRVLAKPPVRKLAKDLGVDLTRLTGEGPQGSVTREQVQAAATSTPVVEEVAQQPSRNPASTGARETREPIKGVRKMMGQAMVDSAFTAPHVTEWVTLDATRTMELVERLKSHREFRDVKVSPLLVLAKACLLAIRRTPEINSFWDEAAQEVVYKHYVNLGIAAATPRGLVVPNVKDADAMTLRELAEALGDLTATAREGKTQPADMSGGSFTITNVGVFGVDAGTPIINPGESAILCFGSITRKPWVVVEDGEERVVPRHVTTLALSFDHRHVDGEKGSRFLADVAAILEDPASALLTLSCGSARSIDRAEPHEAQRTRLDRSSRRVPPPPPVADGTPEGPARAGAAPEGGNHAQLDQGRARGDRRCRTAAGRGRLAGLLERRHRGAAGHHADLRHPRPGCAHLRELEARRRQRLHSRQRHDRAGRQPDADLPVPDQRHG